MPSITSAAAWPVQAPFFLVLAAAVLYHLGGRRRAPGHRESAERRWRSAAFYGGLLTIVVATDTPLDPLSDTLFTAHMTQHILLLMVAPGLIVLAAPWLRLWQPLPLGFRRTVAKSVARGSWAAPLRACVRTLARPVPAWIAFNAVVVGWHVPALYDAALSNEAVHDLEHALFFVAGIVFWLQIVDSPPVRARLEYGLRAVYLTGALLVSWVLAIVLALASSPLYPAYAHLDHRTAGLSALADQQIAGGVMWVPGSVPFTIAFIWALYRWLDPAEDPSIRARRNGHPPRRRRASLIS
ncbi:MAG TPA: cytochrome c oxidase assembly protein [Gaiellaceae bacterium]|nr:cytochrome c oxidase assembly protein [Gaiellaceae bacterium]